MSIDRIAEIWKQQKIWSAVASRRKTRIMWSRVLVLVLGIGGAFCETLATQVPAGRPQQLCAATGAVFLAVMAFWGRQALTAEKTRAWVRARSASEGLKSELYTYWARAEPYDGAHGDPLNLLEKAATDIENDVADLAAETLRVQPKIPQPPGPLSPEQYIEQRVRGEIDGYYEKSARKYLRNADWLRNGEFALGLIAMVLGGIAAKYTPSWGAWVAVLTTAGGALTAHLTSSQYDYMATSFHATARRLTSLCSQWLAKGGGPVSSPEWSKFVRDCEDAISVQHKRWMAKWVQPPRNAGTPAEKTEP